MIDSTEIIYTDSSHRLRSPSNVSCPPAQSNLTGKEQISTQEAARQKLSILSSTKTSPCFLWSFVCSHLSILVSFFLKGWTFHQPLVEFLSPSNLCFPFWLKKQRIYKRCGMRWQERIAQGNHTEWKSSFSWKKVQGGDNTQAEEELFSAASWAVEDSGHDPRQSQQRCWHWCGPSAQIQCSSPTNNPHMPFPSHPDAWSPAMCTPFMQLCHQAITSPHHRFPLLCCFYCSHPGGSSCPQVGFMVSAISQLSGRAGCCRIPGHLLLSCKLFSKLIFFDGLGTARSQLPGSRCSGHDKMVLSGASMPVVAVISWGIPPPYALSIWEDFMLCYSRCIYFIAS